MGKGSISKGFLYQAFGLSCLLLLMACSGSYRGEERPVETPIDPDSLPKFSMNLAFVNEHGEAIEGVQMFLGDQQLTSNASGQIQLTDLQGPVVGVVRTAGYLAEPVPIGWMDSGKTVTVTLFSDSHWSMHASGDAMFGRRYLAPISGDPLLPANDIAGGASQVVASLKDAFAAADFRTINLETTVSNLSEDDAYPGKRFILNSPPESLSAVQDLGADLVILANNHTRDYGDQGVIDTVAALDQYNLNHIGAGETQEQAEQGDVSVVKGVRIASLSYTTVTGSFVNDNYPSADEPVPADLPETEQWQYEARTWSYTGTSYVVPAAARRIGEAWRVFKNAESDLSPEDVAGAWASMAAVYPEMQDWVARRGHGGAAIWNTTTARNAIAQLKEENDLVMVQLHSGFQYQEAASESLRRNARRAIDAGADMIICHHPHVLQGVEWYKGKLIVYSLGNFVFDQDFLVTFSSAFLRTIWQGTELVQARIIPIEIQAYQPALVTGPAAHRTILKVWEMSVASTHSFRDANSNVRAVTIDLDEDTQQAHFKLDHHTAVITKEAPPVQMKNVTVRPNEMVTLEERGLVHGRLGLSPSDSDQIMVGRDTFGWGRFEDEIADGQVAGITHWSLDSSSKQVVLGEAHGDQRYLEITRQSSNSDGLLVRPLARVALPKHRLYQTLPDDLTEPVDPSATYTFRFFARLTGEAHLRVRLDIYEFDDTDPTEDPESLLINEYWEDLDIASGSGWNLYEVEVNDDILVKDGIRGNALNFYVYLSPPTTATATLDVDDLAFIEWRPATQMPDKFAAFGYIRNLGSESKELQVPILPLDE